jgi:hypothetical protein
MGYDSSQEDDSAEGRAVFYATKRMIMISLVILGSGYGIIMLILFITKYLRKEE